MAITCLGTVPKSHNLLSCSIEKPRKTLDALHLIGVKINACLSQSLCNTVGWPLRFFLIPASPRGFRVL